MDSSAVTQRLDRLESYLRQDPANGQLMAEAFAVALSIAAWDRAEFHLRHAQALGLAPAQWRLNEAHWLLAQHRWPEARTVLEALERDASLDVAARAGVAHDLAYIDLREGDPAAGLARLAPLLQEGGEAHAGPPQLQALWLRLAHHAGDLAGAMARLQAWEAAGPLDPSVAGIGSLIALDGGNFAASLRWADLALRGPSPPPEARVARASLALAEQQPARARELLGGALQTNAGDGRTWSAMGFAELLDQRLEQARAAFETAVRAMPDHIGTWHGLGWTAIAQRDLEGARLAFDSALQLDRNFPESHGGAAVVSALQGRDADARTAIARALGLDRHSLSARYAEALLAGDARDVQAVLRLGERILGDRQGPLGGSVMTLLRRVRGRPG